MGSQGITTEEVVVEVVVKEEGIEVAMEETVEIEEMNVVEAEEQGVVVEEGGKRIEI